MKKKSILGVLIALAVGVAVLLPPFCVKASANPVIEFSSAMGLASIIDESNSASLDCEKAPFKFLSMQTNSSGKYVVTINKVGYSNASVTSAERKNIMEVTLDAISTNTSMSKQSRVKFYNFVAQQDTAVSSLVRQLSTDVDGDFAKAYSYIKPFSGTIGVILGVFSFIIFIFLAIMILVDLAYIALPAFRIGLTGAGGNKPKLVSNEAYTSVLQAEGQLSSNGDYNSTLSVYFRRKTGQIVILSICILYLVSGKIYILVGMIIDAFQGIIG